MTVQKLALVINWRHQGTLRTIFLADTGGWPRLNSKKRLWVAHPCGFCKGGVFFLSLF